MKKSLILCLTTLSFLSACASTPESKEVAKSTPPVASSSAPTTAAKAVVIANTNANMAKIYVTRDFIVPTGLKAKVSIGERKLGSLKNGQYFEAFIEPGDHVLELSFPKIFMVRGQKQNISVAAGETYAWEIENSLGVGGAVVSRTQNVRIKYFDPLANPYKISDLKKAKVKN